MKSAGLPKIEMAGRSLSVPYAPPGAKRIDDDDVSLLFSLILILLLVLRIFCYQQKP